MRHDCAYTCGIVPFTRAPFSRGVRVDERAQFKQVCDAKEASSSPHNNNRINGAEVGKLFRNRSRAPITVLKIHAVLRQTFSAAQLFEFLSKQRMKRMHYAKPLQPLVTTICSD